MKTLPAQNETNFLDRYLFKQTASAQDAYVDRHIAKDLKSSQPVLLETIDQSIFSEEAQFRFKLEFQKLCQIENSNVDVPLDFGIVDGTVYVANNEIRGVCLGQADLNKIEISQKLDCAIDILKGLKAVHNQGLVHRNIQVNCIYLNELTTVLGGLGISRYVSLSDQGLKQALDFSTYVSPELSGALVHDIGPASDLYSIGAVLFQLFSGQPPFVALSVNDMLFQHLTDEPPMDKMPKSVEPVIQEVLKVLLRKEPAERYQSAESVIYDLEEIRNLLKSGQSTDDFVICRNELKPDVCDPAFVGRKLELEQLKSELISVKEKSHSQVLISCPSGIGKSRLVIEFMRQASKQNVTVLTGRGSNEAGRVPMGALIEVIDQLGERLSGEVGLAQLISSQLDGYADEIAAVCPEFAKLVKFDNVNELTGPEEFGQNRIENALAKLLATVSSSKFPLMVWVDDCQWLDEQTHKILSLVREFEPSHLMMLYTMRSECQKTYKKFVADVEPDKKIQLGHLSVEEVALLQESMTGPLPHQAAQAVVRHADGSPFMASAVVRGMFESGAIKPDPTGWIIDRVAFTRIQAADDAAQVLLQRLQQLSPETLGLLSIAAIIGKEFDIQIVSEISGLVSIDRHVELARVKRLIWSKPNGTFSFVHDKIRESLIGMLNPEDKKQLHLRLAKYMEANRRDRIFDLAFHFHRANCAEAALPFALEAAKLARQRFSLKLAEDQLQIAISGLANSSPQTRFQVNSLYADITMVDGRYGEAEKWLREAAAFAGSAMEKASMVMKQGELEFKRGNKIVAVEHFEKALSDLGYRTPRFFLPSLAYQITKQALHSIFPSRFVSTKVSEATEADRLAWQLLSKLAQGYWFTRSKYETLWAHLRGMNLSERYKPTPELAQAYSEHAPVMSLLPWHNRGIKYADRSLALRKEFGDIWGQGQSRNFKSILLYSASNFDSCIEQARRAITVLERTGDYWEVHVARYQLASSLYRKGNLQAAVREAKETYQAALELGDFQSTANIIDVWVRANLNRLPSEVLEREMNRVLDDTQGQCQALLVHGIALIGLEEYSDAAAKFRRAIQISVKADVLNTYISPNYAWMATAMRLKFEQRKVSSAVAQRKPLRALVGAAKKAVRVGRSFKNELPHALRELGAAMAFAGKFAKSRKALLESIEVAKKQGALYEQTKSELMLSQFADEFGWEKAPCAADPSHRLREMELVVSEEQSATTLSIVDRFDCLLEAGRKISNANLRGEISRVCANSANRLLRSQRSVLVDDFSDSSHFRDQVDMQLVRAAVKKRESVISNQETLSNNKTHRCDGSYLACPIVADGEVTSVLYAGNDAVSGLFGENEARIAEFLATAAGAAFEKADRFRGLEEMNESLEMRVAQRTETIRARSSELEVTATELRRTQKSLEEARDAAQQASDAKSEFLARMSHEIRTPIAAINGFTELILRGVVRPEEQKGKLETILGSGRHLLRLINNLLDLSKVEADQMDTELLYFSPSSIANEVVQSLYSQATEKSLCLNVQIDGKIPRLIQSDPTRFRQILTNLVGNAIKFTADGSVTLRLGYRPCLIDGQRNSFTVEVVDTGIGMTEEQTAKIFLPFVQADTSTTRKFGGTGLGLSISNKLAKELGGDIQVTSEMGKGSCFRLEIAAGPVDEADVINQSSMQKMAPSSSFREWNCENLEDKRILIVDDAETNRDLLTLVLRDCGAHISTCVNGQQAVDEIATGREFDIVLMDMQMPVLDGYSATKLIRKLNPHLPVIALTANSMKNDDQKCYAAGCSDYLSKPIETEALFQKISFHISKSMADRANCGPEVPGSAAHCSQSDASAMVQGAAIGEPKIELPIEGQNKQKTVPGSLAEKIAELADKFVLKLERRLTEIRTALANKDFEAIADIGHWLKGTAYTVGLVELGELGSQLDQAGKEERFQVASLVLGEIESKVQEALSDN